MTEVGSSARNSAAGRSFVRMPPAGPSGMRHWLPDAFRDHAMKQCPFCAGVIPDASTICKHCKQSIPSARPASRRSSTTWALLAILGVTIALGAPVLFWMRMGTPAGAATDTGRRGQLIEGLQAAMNMGTAGKQCESPTAVADAWRKLKVAKSSDPEWDYAGKMAAQLEGCRLAIAKTLSASIGDLRHKQRLEQAETVRRSLQTQGFDTSVTLTGPDRNEVVIAAPQLTGGMLDRITSNLSMGAGSFLEAWQKLGCVRVTFTNRKQKWAYDLPLMQEAVPDVSVLTDMGLGAPLVLP
jgi:hypothetical protein